MRNQFISGLTITILLQMLLLASVARASDWPQFRGERRDSVWNEGGIMQTFPPGGLKLQWRAAVGYGLSSPVVSGGRVYLLAAELKKPEAHECLFCFDEASGRQLWKYAHAVGYPDWAFDPSQKGGPNSTPTVHDGKIYTLGQMGDLICLDAVNGGVIWQRNLMKDYGMKEFTGTTPCPLIEESLLIVAVGCPDGAAMLALDKDSGKEVWKALDDPATYSSPLIIEAAGQRQLITWTPKAVTSLNPKTGEIWWREELNTVNDYGVATPVFEGDLLLVSGLMFKLDLRQPGASVLWPETKPMSKRIFSHTAMPVIKDGYVYSGKMNGLFVCVEAGTGKQVWETGNVTSKAQGAAIHMTRNGDSYLIFTDQGDLLRARLAPEGYAELSRVHVVDPTYPFGGRKLIWPPPAYANKKIFIHNGEELVCASLAAEPALPK